MFISKYLTLSTKKISLSTHSLLISLKILNFSLLVKVLERSNSRKKILFKFSVKLKFASIIIKLNLELSIGNFKLSISFSFSLWHISSWCSSSVNDFSLNSFKLFFMELASDAYLFCKVFKTLPPNFLKNILFPLKIFQNFIKIILRILRRSYSEKCWHSVSIRCRC
jgi:hypothetical protein